MRDPKPRRLPVAVVIDESALQGLQQRARLPWHLDLSRLGRCLPNTIETLVANAQAETVVERNRLSSTLEALARQVAEYEGPPGVRFERLCSKLADKLAELAPSNLSDEWPTSRPNMSAMMVWRAQASGFRALDLPMPPGPDELRNPVRAKTAASRLVMLLSRRGNPRPAPPKGRPIGEVERNLVLMLAHDWWYATGRLPPRRFDSRKKGPFVRFVEEVLVMTGMRHASAADAVELVNLCSPIWYQSSGGPKSVHFPRT